MPVLICVAMNGGQCTLYDNLGDISSYSLHLYATKSACERAGAAAVKRWSKDGSSYSYYCLNVTSPSLPPQSPATRFQPAPTPAPTAPAAVPEPPGRPAPDGSAVAEPPPAPPVPGDRPGQVETAAEPPAPAVIAPPEADMTQPPAAATVAAGVTATAGMEDILPPPPAPPPSRDRPETAEPPSEPPARVVIALPEADIPPPPAAAADPPPGPSAAPTAIAPDAADEPSPPVRDERRPAIASGQGEPGETVAAGPLPGPPEPAPLPARPAVSDGPEQGPEVEPADAAAAPESRHLPWFVTPPGGTDYLFNAMAFVVIAALIAIGNLFFKLHALPERWAHRANPFQLEIVAVLSLVALFTHQHVFWVAALLLALVRFPDYGTPLRSMSESLARLVRRPPRPADAPRYLRPGTAPAIIAADARPGPARAGGGR